MTAQRIVSLADRTSDPSIPTSVRSAGSLAPLRDAFNAHAGRARLIALMSPT